MQTNSTTDRDRLAKYVSYTPNNKQMALHEMCFYAFVHFGMNTFTGAEWGDGKTPVSEFNPTNLDTDQWCETMKTAGIKGVILTAKHHDGFCLWQTDTTEYSIKNSPYKDGKGDILAQLRESCDKYGLKLGVYLSPWDRNSEYYGTDKYNDFYVEQLKEILTNYGELFCIWFDGACGSHMDGKPMQKYDFARYYAVCNELQPNCAISNCGPDVRWVGNEGGFARESEYNVVPEFAVDVQSIMENSQKDDDGDFKRNATDIVSEDLGSRKALEGFDSFMWYPAEVDVSIRPGWFYHSSQDKMVRSLKNLLKIYFNSVGGNCFLLLNLPPDKSGRIAPPDVARLKELGDAIKDLFSKKVEIKSVTASPAKEGFSAEDMIKGKGTYSPNESVKYTIELSFDLKKVDKMVLREDLNYSQRVEKFSIYTTIGGKEKQLFEGSVIGNQKFAVFKPVTTDNLTLVIDECRLEPYIRTLEIYEKTGKTPRTTLADKIVKWGHKVSYNMYVKGLERANKKSEKNAKE